MAYKFLVRNLPQIQGDDPYLSEALQDIIQQVSALQQQIQTLQTQVEALTNARP
jgi:septal ring factor EnvC (AmiA/AmiB activator)